MKFAIAIFLLIAFTIILSAHLFVYYSAVRFFNIADEITRKTILLAAVLLSLSFVIGSVLTRVYEGQMTFKFYYLASIWSGLFVNLLVASILLWIIIELANTSGLNPNTKILASILFIVAILVTAYGMYNASDPKIKYYTINIKNLPSGWENKTAVQISDLHLGAILREKFINQVVDKINSVNPDIVFITGDYLDGTCTRYDLHIQPLSRLNAKDVFFINGNHETYIGLDHVKTALDKTKVKYLRDEKVVIDGLDIIGLDYPIYRESKNYAKILSGLISNNPNILLFHEPKLIKIAKANGIDFQINGHTHAGQLFPIGLITRLIYKKYHSGLYEEKDYTHYTSSGTGTWGPPVRTGNTPEIAVFKFKK